MAVEVKICGLTRAADAAAAVTAGASYLGVVFASGPRLVDASAARGIVQAAGSVPVFGVFGAQPTSTILRVRDEAGLRGAQLHGRYRVADARALAREGLIVWRVVRVADAADLRMLPEAAEGADAVLVEARVGYAEGGAGVPLALELALEARRLLAGRRMVLAGGLEPDSVRAAAALVRPEVVDVSSGVEFRAGVKDPARVVRFLEAIA